MILTCSECGEDFEYAGEQDHPWDWAQCTHCRKWLMTDFEENAEGDLSFWVVGPKEDNVRPMREAIEHRSLRHLHKG